MLIDFHAHAFPDKVAEKAIPKLAGIGGIENVGNGTIRDLLAKMDAWGVDRSVILNIATNAHQQTSVNNFAIETNASQPRLYALGSLHPDSGNIAEEARRLSDVGIRGIKLHPDYVTTVVDDPKFDPIYKACLENNLFVVTHAGWDFISPDFIHCTPERILHVLEKFPGIRLVAAHMGSNKLWDDVERLLIGKNLWIDTSMAVCLGMDRVQCERMLKNHDPEKILFGSDFPWFRPCDAYEYINSLDLSAGLKENIFSKNAIRLVGDK